MTKEWRTRIIIKNAKKGGNNEYGNWKGTTFICGIMKIIFCILYSHINIKMKHKLRDNELKIL